LRGIKQLGIGCFAGTVGLVTFLVVLGVLGKALGWLISPLGDPIVTIVGLVGVIVVGAIAWVVTWQTIVWLHRLTGFKTERELFIDTWLPRLLQPGETVRAVLAGGVAHDAPAWSHAVPVMGTDAGLVTASEFLESTCGLVLTDRRIVLVREHPSRDPDVRDYPITDSSVTDFRMGPSSLVLSVSDRLHPPLSIGFNFVLDREQRHAAETLATVLGSRA